MTNSIRIILSVLFITSVIDAFILAQDSLSIDEVVITGTRFNIPVEKSGKSIYKITQEDLQRSAGSDIQDILNQVPGLHFNGNFGTPGTNIQYASRGGGERQILILIDGIPISDPSGIEAFYDLRLLSVDQVESIEVLKGGLSTLYGTGASTGVINIQLKKPADEKINGSVDLHAGSYGAIGGNVMAHGKSGNHSYLASVGIEHVGGFSAASDVMSTTPFGDDGIDQLNTLIKYGYVANDQFGIDLMGMYNDIDLDYDDGSFIDAANTQLVDEIRIGISPKYSYGKGKVTLNSSYSNGDRSFQSSFPSQFNTRLLQADLVQEHRLSNSLNGLWGLQWQKNSYTDGFSAMHRNAKITIIDPYASMVLSTGNGINIHAGIRLNHHSDYGSNWVFNLNPSYLIKLNNQSKLKIRGSISSAYNTPSLYQLHDPFFGNSELNPEETMNMEVGVSYYLCQSLNWNITYFTRDETNPIGFESQLDNMGNFIGGNYITTTSERDVNGLETDVSWKINGKWNMTTNYAYVNSSNPMSLYRLPKHKGGANIQFVPSSSTSIGLNYLFTGSRRSFEFFVFEEIELEAYNLFDLLVQQVLLDNQLMVYGSLNNLMGTDYVDIYGFTTRGRNWKLGVKWSL